LASPGLSVLLALEEPPARASIDRSRNHSAFEMLGTSDPDKKLVMAPGGHSVPREILISETLKWLD
jgi:hypothetical protein